MPFGNPSGLGLIGVLLSIVVAMVLCIMPTPPAWFIYNPDWLALILIYWTLIAPDRVSVFTAWVVGLTADVLTGRLLGQHALAYAIMGYLNIRMRQHLLLLPPIFQCVWVFLILALTQLLVLWTQRIELAPSMRIIYWLPSASGALAWPILVWVMQGLGRVFRGL